MRVVAVWLVADEFDDFLDARVENVLLVQSRPEQEIQTALDRVLAWVILEDPAEELDDLGVIEARDRAPPIGKAPAEGRSKGAVGLHEQLAVHPARHVERMPQARRHDRGAAAPPLAVAEHEPERAIEADMQDRSAVDMRLEMLQRAAIKGPSFAEIELGVERMELLHSRFMQVGRGMREVMCGRRTNKSARQADHRR